MQRRDLGPTSRDPAEAGRDGPRAAPQAQDPSMGVFKMIMYSLVGIVIVLCIGMVVLASKVYSTGAQVESVETAIRSLKGHVDLLRGDQPGIVTISLVTVKAGREDEFLENMQRNAIGMRHLSQDPGAVRFDILQKIDDRGLELPNQFAVYEVFWNEEGLKKHEQTEHGKAWERLNAKALLRTNTPIRSNPSRISGGWAFQSRSPDPSCIPMSLGIQVLEVSLDHVSEFLAEMRAYVAESRSRVGVCRVDVLLNTVKRKQDMEQFLMYYAYKDKASQQLKKLEWAKNVGMDFFTLPDGAKDWAFQTSRDEVPFAGAETATA